MALSTQRTPAKPSLLGLPFELRHRIYTVTSWAFNIYPDRHRFRSRRQQRLELPLYDYLKYPKHVTQTFASLFLTCKTIREEIEAFMLAYATFTHPRS